jgi:hypothetical protein
MSCLAAVGLAIALTQAIRCLAGRPIMDAYSQKDLFAVERLANSLSLSDPSRNLFEGVLASVRLQTDQANLALKRFLEISSAERQLKEVALFFLSENC